MTAFVEADFSGTAFAGSPTWTDITSYTLDVSGSWGRQDWFSTVSPGQCSLTLHNGDGRFTPGRSGLVSNMVPPDIAAPGCVSHQVASSFVTGGATFAYDSTGKTTGNPSSLKATVPSGQTLFSAPLSVAMAFPVTAGLTYSASVQVNNTAPISGAALEIVWETSVGGFISTTLGSVVSPATTGFSSVVNATAPPTAAFAQLFVIVTNSAPASNVVWYLGNWELERASAPLFEKVAPYYPNVRYGTRVRYREVVGATTCYMFDGYVNDWTAVPANGDAWQAQVGCTDLLGRMAGATALRGFLTEEMLVDSPAWMFPLQEDEGSTSFGDITGQMPASTIVNSKYGAGTVDAGQEATGTFIAGTTVSVTNDSYLTVASGVPSAGSWLSLPGPTSVQFSFEIWAQIPSVLNPSADGTIAGWGTGYQLGTGFGFWLEVSPGGQVIATLIDGSIPTSIDVGTATGAADDQLHQIVVTLDPDLKTAKFYLDGTLKASGVAPTAFSRTPGSATTLGMASYLGGSLYPLSAAYAFAAYYPSTLSAGRVLAHYNAGANAFAGETTAAHVTRILSYRPNLGSSLETPVASVGSQDILGETQQQALIETAAAEAGALWTDGQGVTRFRARSHQFNPTAVLTLDASLGQVDVSSEFRDDIQGVVNDETISRVNGADQRFYSAAHQAQYGVFTDSQTLNVDTDQNALVLASWVVANGTLDQLTMPPLSCNLLAMLAGGYTSLVASVLQLAPMDCVALTNLPVFSPTVGSVMVQGGSYERSGDAFTVSLNTTPLPQPVVVIDGDAAHGIGSTAVVAAA